MKESLQAEVLLTDAIFHRRAVRSYSPRPVEKAAVDQLLLAAVQAPSALNQQPWGFAVLHGHARLRDYSERAKRHLVATYPTLWELHSRSELYENPSYDLFHGANTLIVIYAMSGRLQPTEDCCLAAENLMLAAYGIGLAAVRLALRGRGSISSRRSASWRFRNATPPSSRWCSDTRRDSPPPPRATNPTW